MRFGKQTRYCPNCGRKYYDEKLSTNKVLSMCCIEKCLEEWQIKNTRMIMGKDEKPNLSSSPTLSAVIADVGRRREDQDRQHGGPEHDDTHYYGDWTRFIKNHLDKAYASAVRDRLGLDGNFSLMYEEELIDVAALAIAAIQSHRRKREL